MLDNPGLYGPRRPLPLRVRPVPGESTGSFVNRLAHANGLSLARKLAERLPQGYLAEVEPGLSFGAALLAPTVLYAPLTESLHRAGITPHYAANITGHAGAS